MLELAGLNSHILTITAEDRSAWRDCTRTEVPKTCCTACLLAVVRRVRRDVCAARSAADVDVRHDSV